MSRGNMRSSWWRSCSYFTHVHKAICYYGDNLCKDHSVPLQQRTGRPVLLASVSHCRRKENVFTPEGNARTIKICTWANDYSHKCWGKALRHCLQWIFHTAKWLGGKGVLCHLLVLPQHTFPFRIKDFKRVEDGLLWISTCVD